MSIVNTFSLQSNRQIKINFDGGDLSSDAGLLLIKEFAAKIGFVKLIKKNFKTNDKSVRLHKDHENLLQMIYQIISAYFQDDCADELTLNPVFQAILDKESLASQPTLSRFFNRMDEDTLIQFDDIYKNLRDIIYSIKRPEHPFLIFTCNINKLATLSSLRQSTIDNILRGKSQNPKVRTLHKIATVFGMTLSEFLDFPELNDYSIDDEEDDD